jgi:hypothetical protein
MTIFVGEWEVIQTVERTMHQLAQERSENHDLQRASKQIALIIFIGDCHRHILNMPRLE